MKDCLKNSVYKNIPLLIVCIPCRVQVRGLRLWGGQRQGWVNESFLTILEVILNKATLLWEVERNLMAPVCVGSLCPRDAHIQRMTESHFFQAKPNLCFHNTVGSCKCKPHRTVPNLWTNSPLRPEIPSLNHLSSVKDSFKKLRKENTEEIYFHPNDQGYQGDKDFLHHYYQNP